jgi:small redox-active disulfide protein 2
VVNIKVLGPGCANCKRLEQIAQKAVENLSIEAEIEKVTDYAEILALGVMATPGLVINEKVVSSGRIPAEIEVLDWLSAAAS